MYSSHTKFTDNVNKKKDLIEKKKAKLILYEEKLKYHDEHNIKKETYIFERISILEEIENIKTFLNDIEDEELNYYSKTLNILLDYYNFNKVYNTDEINDKINNGEPNNDIYIHNNKNDVGYNNENDVEINNDLKKVKENKKNSIDKLLILNEISRNGKKEKKNTKKKSNKVSNNIFNYINDKDEQILKIINKSTLFEDYRYITENISKKIDNDKCISCGANKIIYRNFNVK